MTKQMNDTLKVNMTLMMVLQGI